MLNGSSGKIDTPVIGKCGKDCRLCPAFQERRAQTATQTVELLTIDMEQGPAEGTANKFFKLGWTRNR